MTELTVLKNFNVTESRLRENFSQPPHQLTRNISVVSSSNGNRIRLPKISLEKFSRYYIEFDDFWESFCLAVDETELTAMEKFTYLKSVLIGDASHVISGMAANEDNYKIAKDLLKEKYGNKQKISQHLYNKIKSLQRSNMYVPNTQNLRCTGDITVSFGNCRRKG